MVFHEETTVFVGLMEFASLCSLMVLISIGSCGPDKTGCRLLISARLCLTALHGTQHVTINMVQITQVLGQEGDLFLCFLGIGHAALHGF
jgi:hypothetical protein